MQVGAYEVLSPLGSGGFGVVYRARAADGRPLAVKVLSRSTPEALARFDRERRLLSSLGAAEGFVPILDAGVAPAGPYVVMPLLEGGTLRDRLAKGPLPVEEAALLVATVAEALGRAHARGIVHRDMKPENVLFDGLGRPCVADLGLAKHFRADHPGASRSLSITADGQFQGTLGYMAPEQMSDVKTAGPPADVFALGSILYECLAGRPAFVGDTALAIIASVEQGKVEPVTTLRPDTPRWLATMVHRALAPRPEKRYRDGMAFGAALRAGAKSGDGGARGIIAAALVVVLGLVAGGAALALSSSRREPVVAKPAPPPPPAPTKPPPPPPSVTAQRAAELAQEAERRRDSGDLDGALDAFTRALEQNPKRLSTLVNRAELHKQRGDLVRALADVDRAIELDESYVHAWVSKSAIRLAMSDNAGSAADASRAIELQPTLALAWVRRALARGRLNDRKGELADLDRALELDAKNVAALANRSGLQLALHKYDLAIADATRAIELDPQCIVAYANRGDALRAKGSYTRALADLDKAVALNPQVVAPRRARGYVKANLRDYKGALEDFDRVLAQSPGDALARDGRAQVLALMK